MSDIKLTPEEAKLLAAKLTLAISTGYVLEVITNIQNNNIISFEEYTKLRLSIFLKNIKSHDDIVNIISANK